MYKSQRQQEIIKILKEHKFLSVEKISQLLYVSKPTIRRDLAELERQNLISRSHGGASTKNEHNSEVPIDFRNTFQTKAKATLAKCAVELIKDGDVIFIDSSTTTLHIPEYCKSKKITVITNSIQAASILRNTGITVYSTGGKLVDDSLAYGGSVAEATLEKFNIDIMFFSSYGLLENGEIQDYSEPETALRIKALNSAKISVFLCDNSKLGKKSLFNVCNVSNIDYLITNADLPSDFPSPKIKLIKI